VRAIHSPYLDNAVIDNGVSLVTSTAAGRANVMTASFFAENSHVPVLLRVAVARSCLTHDLISASGWFGLSVLHDGQRGLALKCGTLSGRDFPQKLQRLGLSYWLGTHGVPLLSNCLTTSECRVADQFELGDHTLFLGEIVGSFRQTACAFREPLLVSDLLSTFFRDEGAHFARPEH